MTTVVPSFFNVFFFAFLQTTRKTIKTSKSLCQIQPLTTELAVLECLKNQCLRFFSVAIDLIHFKLADNEDMHNTVSVKKKALIPRCCAKKANGKLSFSQRNSEKKKKFLGEISRRFAAKFLGVSRRKWSS